MIPREHISLLLLTWLSLAVTLDTVSAERWSRQVTNSEWIPLANPRSSSQQSQSFNQVPVLPDLNLPPQLRQEYQQQILQLQKTQESIQKLLLLQQQLKSQQQLLQNQAYLPNAVGPDDERQSYHQNPHPNHQNPPEPSQEMLTPPQILPEPVPPVYSPQDFRQSPRDESYETSGPKDSNQEGPAPDAEKPDDEEIQVVYVPAETLAQRGQSKEERNRDQKHYRFHHDRQQAEQYESQDTSSPEEVPYNTRGSVNHQNNRDETDFLKAARDRELERLNEQRREIQKQAKLQAAAMQREQERMRQRESEKKRKELMKLEEAAKQRELERIREARERQRAREEREKERAAKARQGEIDRQAALERQKKAELEKLARKEEERLKAERREKEASESIQQEYVGHYQQQLESGKQKSRARPKPRPRVQHRPEEPIDRSQETSTPPTPNQPPLAVYMGSDLGTGEIKILDLLRVLRDAKTIAVVDQLTPDAPKVFVGPSNLETPPGYAKFDLPYLSSLDTNRVERRVDKLPFFVAPLSFNPPPGYSKIPFPAPHIGSVIVNLENPGNTGKPNPQPLIEPNSFSPSNQDSTYQPSYQSTTPSYSTYPQELVTQYPTSNFAPTSTERFRYRQPQYQSNVHHLDHQENVSLSPYKEEIISPPSSARPHRPDYPEEDISEVTPGINYRKPTVVSSFSYEQDPVSTTPTYQDSYVHTRVQPNSNQDLTSQLAQINQHDYSQHRHADQVEYQHPGSPGSSFNNGQKHVDQVEYQHPGQSGSSFNHGQKHVDQLEYQHPGQSGSSFNHGQKHVDQVEYQQPSSPGSSFNQGQKHVDQVEYQHPGPSGSSLHHGGKHSEYQHSVQSGSSLHHGGNHQNGESVGSSLPGYEQGGALSGQYNLPAELPPIHPQLPGLVNSLIDNKEERTAVTTTSTTPIPKTTQATTTHRTRGKHRGRVTSRPITTTTAAVRESSRGAEKRRPAHRSRSRYTTTTEEYRERDEGSRKAPETTTKYSEGYRRNTAKGQKVKSRTSERPYESSTANQIQSIQSHETASDEAHRPVDLYSPQNSQISNENQGSYGNYENSEDSTSSFTPEIDYSKTQNYPHPVPQHREHRPLIDDTGIPQQHFQNRNQAPVGYQASLIEQNEQYNYPIHSHNKEDKSGLSGSLPSNEYYYTESNERLEAPGRQDENPTESPVYTQILEYRPGSQPESSQQGQSNEYSQTSQYSGERSSSASVEDSDRYSHYSSQEPIEQTTEPIQTTTTEPPQIIRQRVRGRLSSRTRPDSTIQTNPRGSQDDFVQFSPISKPASRVPSSRPRDSARGRSKPQNRPYQNQAQAQVQSEGNEYVRIQSSNRQNYPKTIVQAAARVSTTPAPMLATTTEESGLHDTSDDYGFIRPPNFNQPQHQISSKFRAPESQIQLQNIAPTDETAEDSSPSLAQVPKHRQKYQSPNRPRPDIKSTATPSVITTTPALDGFTNKPRIRNEEPKNRIRGKNRRPGSRRRPATTSTSTTTEYVLDGNNNLPLDENYPRLIGRTESSVERQGYESYEGLPHASQETATSRVDYSEENYPPDFLINFGGNSGVDEQQDQSQTASAPRRQMHRHGSTSGRLRTYSHQAAAASPERDIYGAESQWSTKLSQSSFQPSSNQLNRDDNKTTDKPLETSEEVPEIITAQPEQAFVTVLVTSDDKFNETKEEINSEEVSIETASEFGQKMSAEVSTNSSEAVDGPQVLKRRPGGRRRRVRVRIRPASSREDFVTSESQHINSAVNNLVQEATKPDRSTETNRFTSTTQETTEIPTTLSTDAPNTEQPIEFDVTTISYTELPWDTNSSDSTTHSMNNEETIGVTSVNDLTTEKSGEEVETTLSDRSTEAPLMTTMTVPRKSWDSTKGYTDWFIKKQQDVFTHDDESQEIGGHLDESGSHFEENGSHLEENGSHFVKNGSHLEKNGGHLEKSGDHFEATGGHFDNVAGHFDDVGGHLDDSVSHPKNHRSEWSEVRYPDDKTNFYGNSHVVPGLVTKAVGDSSVKTLSDYVQAIFDTMKSAEGERAIAENAPDLWQDEAKPRTSTEVYNFPADLSTIMGFRETADSGDKNEIEEVTTESDRLDEVPTTIQVPVTSDVSTTSGELGKLGEMTEIAGKNMSSTADAGKTKLGAILRTSTTTKVSHMTEICYRGRCVMTKPRKDSREKR